MLKCWSHFVRKHHGWLLPSTEAYDCQWVDLWNLLKGSHLCVQFQSILEQREIMMQDDACTCAITLLCSYQHTPLWAAQYNQLSVWMGCVFNYITSAQDALVVLGVLCTKKPYYNHVLLKMVIVNFGIHTVDWIALVGVINVAWQRPVKSEKSLYHVIHFKLRKTHVCKKSSTVLNVIHSLVIGSLPTFCTATLSI